MTENYPEDYHAELLSYVNLEAEQRILEIGMNLWSQEPDNFAKRLKHVVDVDRQASLLIAEHNETSEIAGFLVVRHFINLRKTVGSVEDFVVDPAYRRLGIGRLLMQFAEYSLRQRGCESIEITSQPTREAAHRLYESLGYQKHDIDVFHKTLRTT